MCVCVSFSSGNSPTVLHASRRYFAIAFVDVTEIEPFSENENEEEKLRSIMKVFDVVMLSRNKFSD